MTEGMETPRSEPEIATAPAEDAPAPVPEPVQYEQAPPPEIAAPAGPEPFMTRLFLMGFIFGILAILINPITWWLIGAWGIASLEAICMLYLLAGIFTLITLIMMILVFLKETNKMKGLILLLLFIVSTLILLWPYIFVATTDFGS